jgi:hypothetical protein
VNLDLVDVCRGELRHWKNHEDMQLGGTAICESMEDAGWDEDTFTRSENESFVSQTHGDFAGKEVQDLLTGMGVIEHSISRLQPLLTEIE